MGRQKSCFPDEYESLLDQVESLKEDFTKSKAGNAAAGVRFRKALRELEVVTRSFRWQDKEFHKSGRGKMIRNKHKPSNLLVTQTTNESKQETDPSQTLLF